MPQSNRDTAAPLLERLARRATQAAGTSWAFGSALLTVVVWGFTGPIFRYSETWQLVINTGTTIVTFLMVFLIQRSQNTESLAVQLKLNEIVAALQGASNRLIAVENLSEDELQVLQRHYARLVTMAQADTKLTDSHSVEEATERHESKKQAQHGIANPREKKQA
jgi:low affinity Fe/Cu permease